MEETKPLVSPDPFTNHCDLYGSLAVQIVSLAYGGILIVLALVFLYLGYNGLTVPDNKWYQKVFPYALCVLLLLRGVFVELSALRIYCVMFVFVLGAMALPEILITAFVLLYVWGRDESQKPICPN
ncbi:hypothetical protein Pelo_6237 [Pelomyxa schiedti]|nr:hypothetical protein Pelo_6237 [Pelomyxa schiedti]